ncbi:MAG: hypothetical protein EPO61_13095 [Nitrospirae bacterium]|nr:MAG: hypothetical protein EPO61_13095 [Nitrospirota bacterium]
MHHPGLHKSHHSSQDGKTDFMKRCHPILRPGGVFVVFDPYPGDGETREAFVRRWWTHIQETWKDLSPEELTLVHDHIMGCDFPESPSTLDDFAHKAGLRGRKPSGHRRMVFMPCAHSLRDDGAPVCVRRAG